MKHLLRLFIPLIIIATGCSSSGNDDNITSLISVAANEISFTTNQAGQEQTTIESTGNWSTLINPDAARSWLSVSPATGNSGTTTVTISVLENETPLNRSAQITFALPDGTSDALTINQIGNGEPFIYADKDYILLQRATLGDGINIIIMGDGYTENEINNEGKYENDIREAMEDLFSVYPYDAYRDYFNVWMVIGISNQSGPSIGNTIRDTRFGTRITGNGTDIALSGEDIVTEYARSIPGIPQDESLLTVLLIINSPVYAGTCIIYSSGYSIAMCPRIVSPSPNSDARAVIIHECGGHGFGKLADEYAYSGTIPPSEQNEVRQWQTLFRNFMNIDFTSNTNQVLWRDFFNYPKYTTNFVQFPISIHEGGLTYTSGVYRPELNSCMNNNINYYNAPSRYEIVRRIMALSGINNNLSLNEFVNQDTPRAASYRFIQPEQKSNNDFIPFGNPILKH